MLALAAELQAAGYDVGPRLPHARALADAIRTEAEQQSISRCLDGGLLELTSDQVAQRVREAGVTLASQDATGRVSTQFLDRLAVDVGAALREQSDTIVKAMRPTFTKAVTVMKTAAGAGITSTTDADEVVRGGDAKRMDLFRQLLPVTRTLDDLASLRDQLTQLCDVGPHEYPAAAWLADAATLLDIEGAAGHADNAHTVPYSRPMGAGSRQVAVHRTGGRWLALLNAGYKLRLNTGAEAHALVEQAQR